jgi:hypothetical protein
MYPLAYLSYVLVREMESILVERGFDVAGVQTAQNGPVIGFVLRETLRGGSVKEHTRQRSGGYLCLSSHLCCAKISNSFED